MESSMEQKTKRGIWKKVKRVGGPILGAGAAVFGVPGVAELIRTTAEEVGGGTDVLPIPPPPQAGDTDALINWLVVVAVAVGFRVAMNAISPKDEDAAEATGGRLTAAEAARMRALLGGQQPPPPRRRRTKKPPAEPT